MTGLSQPLHGIGVKLKWGQINAIREMDMKPLESVGFWSHADQFLLAAEKVKDPAIIRNDKSRFVLIFPAYYLVGHSIELSLKSFLSAKGYSHSELKKYGHNLERLLSECTRRKLGRKVKLSRIEIQSIQLLNETYCGKKFEYLEYGGFRLPEYHFVFSVARKLLNDLYAYASNSPYNKVLQRSGR